jgi:hypothetical protein
MLPELPEAPDDVVPTKPPVARTPFVTAVGWLPVVESQVDPPLELAAPAPIAIV